jgi:hypothetical protein
MTKIALSVLMASVIISAPAFATQPNGNWSRPSTTGPYCPDVFSSEQDQGTDPSGLLWPDLMRGPAFDGGGQ